MRIVPPKPSISFSPVTGTVVQINEDLLDAPEAINEDPYGAWLVRVEEVSEDTEAPNAYATGFGPSKHVFLWDTLTEGDFTTDEVRVVLAHELAHHSREHILRSLGWYALFAFPGVYLIALATRRRLMPSTPSRARVSFCGSVVHVEIEPGGSGATPALGSVAMLQMPVAAGWVIGKLCAVLSQAIRSPVSLWVDGGYTVCPPVPRNSTRTAPSGSTYFS